MILSKKENFIYFKNGTEEYWGYVDDLHLKPIGTTKLQIWFSQNRGREHRTFSQGTFLITDIKDIDGNQYGTTFLDVIRGLLEIGKQEVYISDQTTPPVEHFMWQELNDVSFSYAPTKGSNQVTLNSGHNVVAGEFINLYYNNPNLVVPYSANRFSQFEVVGVDTNTLTVVPWVPFDVDLEYVTELKRVNCNMAVDGSVTPVKFISYPPNGISWDITRVMIAMLTVSQPSDDKFGDLAALTNGVFFGFEGDNFTEYKIAVHDNGDWRTTAYDVTYSERTLPAGSYGVSIRKSFAGQDKSGVSIRAQSENNDKLVKYVQDDLTGLTRYNVKLLGHIVD